MNSHSLRVLEYEQVRELLVEQISTDLGRELVSELAPLDEEEEIRRRLQETTEARRIMDIAGALPLGGIHDVRAAVQAASRDGMIEAAALLDLADTISSGRRLRGFLLKRGEEAPRLAELGREIGDFQRLEEEIRRCVGPRGDVLDDASPTLARVRKEQKVYHGRMLERLQSILRNSAYRDLIQDAVVTMRDDRYCIPVKSEHRAQFGGLIHDQSASGATVFMEPTVVVELGNELRQLALKERQEVERVLRELAGKVGRDAIPLMGTLHTLSLVDFISAKAKLAFEMEATEPKLNRNGLTELWKARHPLLKGEVVPIDVQLGGEFTQLVITGPNTGGKTVTLKTIGLLALMAQSGLHIPANDGSTLPVFRGIYADIGDEQSIQQSLSTFSAHITNIARILKGVEITGRHSLVLLDEIGAGTDPTEGAALAKAILNYLRQKGARTIGTTHYGELKEYAYSHEGVENASVEFDLETLRPTYRLLIGIPGSSNAFVIAARLGLPEPVLQAARGMLSDEENTISDVIRKLTADQKATEQDLARAAAAAREVDALRQKYDRELRQLQADRRQTLERARADAFELVRSAKRQANQLLDELKRQERERRRGGETFDPARARQQIQRLAQQLNESLPEPAAEEVVESAERAPEPEAPVLTDGALQVGDTVLVAPFHHKGTMLTEPEGGKVQVQVGAMRMTVPFVNLRRVVESRPVETAAGTLAQRRMEMRQTLSPELMLLGMRAEQAMEALDEYIDDACMAGISPVRVVHGKGTGALKKVVWDYLQGHPHVGSFRLGEEGEGGGGVTVVQLKE
jgi:DNA mismatch repair protein MutS2